MINIDWSINRRIVINSLPKQVVVMGLILTALISFYVYQKGYEKEQLQFENEVSRVKGAITDQMFTYLALLQATRGYIYAHDEIDQESFRLFVDELNVREAYPGLQGIGYSQKVSAVEKNSVERKQRAEGLADFTIHPALPARDYFPILYLEPLDERNDIALGFDMYSQEIRRQAMERARDTGFGVLSDKVRLEQEPETDAQPGFLYYIPIYKTKSVPKNIEDRARELRGYAYAPFRAGNFFTAEFEKKRTPKVNLTVFDGDSQLQEDLLYRYLPEESYRPKFTATHQLTIGGHVWTLVFSSQAISELNSERRFVPWLIVGGLLMTTLFYLISRTLVHARLQAEAFQVKLLHSQLELQRSDERMRLVIDGMKDIAIITIDSKGVVTSWNPGADRFFGYTERQISGKPYSLFFTPRERRANKPARDLTMVIEQGTLEFERMMIRKNGTRFWASGMMSALYDPTGLLRGVAIIAQDISHRRQSEEKLRRQESLTQAVMSSLPALIAVVDRNGTIASVNFSWNEFLSKLHQQKGTEQYRVGDHFASLLESDTLIESQSLRKKAVTGMRQVLHKRQEEFVLEYPVDTGSGQIIWFLLTITALKHEGGGVVISNTDITSLKKLEQQKSEFLSIASHELKTPITSARAYVQVVQKQLKQAKQIKAVKIMDKVLSQIEKMQVLINDLLDVSKIEAGKLRLNPQKFVLGELLSEIVEAMQLSAQQHHLELVIDQRATINADRERIGQVITNLIDNAIKYSPRADTVIITQLVEEDNVTVTVQDFGFGMTKADQKQLFQRFFRAQQIAKETVYPGMGLGLYICAEIVRRAGGTMHVESAVGIGSSFSFTLPRFIA